MLFAGGGYDVCIFDVDEKQITKALELTKQTLIEYEEKGYLRGNGTALEQATKITGANTLKECLDGAYYVQVYTVVHPQTAITRYEIRNENQLLLQLSLSKPPSGLTKRVFIASRFQPQELITMFRSQSRWSKQSNGLDIKWF